MPPAAIIGSNRIRARLSPVDCFTSIPHCSHRGRAFTIDLAGEVTTPSNASSLKQYPKAPSGRPSGVEMRGTPPLPLHPLWPSHHHSKAATLEIRLRLACPPSRAGYHTRSRVLHHRKGQGDEGLSSAICHTWLCPPASSCGGER
jgi:hypothetical protein